MLPWHFPSQILCQLTQFSSSPSICSQNLQAVEKMLFFQSRRNQSKPSHLTKKVVHLRTSAASDFEYNNFFPLRIYFHSHAFSESVESMASQMVESLKSKRHHCVQGKELRTPVAAAGDPVSLSFTLAI